jgi:hypothetical protein
MTTLGKFTGTLYTILVSDIEILRQRVEDGCQLIRNTQEASNVFDSR